MRFLGANTTEMYALDVTECGRAPNYFGTNGLEWYCLYYGENFNGPTDETCWDFAKCSLFGRCEPTTPAAPASPTRQQGEPTLPLEDTWLGFARASVDGGKAEDSPFVVRVSSE